MPRPCESCRHSKADEINRRIKQGRTLEDISNWLKSSDEYLSVNALGRHRAHLDGGVYVQPRGQRRFEGDPLDLIIDKGVERIEAGEVNIGPDQVIRAIQAKDARVARNADRDLIAKWTLVLTGQVPQALTSADVIEGEYRETDDFAKAQAEYAALLPGGD